MIDDDTFLGIEYPEDDDLGMPDIVDDDDGFQDRSEYGHGGL